MSRWRPRGRRGRRSRPGGARPPRRSPGRRCARGRGGRSSARRRVSAGRARLVEQAVGLGLLLGERGVERQVERHDDHAQRDDRRAALGGEPRGEVDRLVRLGARRRSARGSCGTRARSPGRAGSARAPSPRAGRRAAGGRRRRTTKPAASQPSPAYRVGASCTTTTNQASPVAGAAEDGEERPVDAAEADARRHAVRLLDRRRLPAQLDHGGVRDREREHRAERVHAADEVDVPGQHERGSRRRPAKTISDSHGVLNRGCSRRKTSGSCR